MRSLSSYWISFIAILALAVFPARADYHYASHEGSDEYPYTSWETAADSIQKAIDASNPHDTVYIDAGEWYESVATGYYDSVGIIGMGIDSTFCWHDTSNVLKIDYSCSVEDITFQSLSNWACLAARTYADVKIKDCKFVYSFNGISAAGGPSEITNCIFDSCGTAMSLPIWIGDFHISNNLILNSYDDWAILLQVNSAVVENNIIINAPGAIVAAVAGAPNYATIRNNVAVNGLGGFGTGAKQKYNNIAMDINRTNESFGVGGADGDTLVNNLTLGCRRGILLVPEGEAFTVNYNAFWENLIDIQAYGNFDSIGNIFVNPMLVSSNDFHLQAFSPLIDAGDPDILDLDGSRSDIGVYGGPYGCSYTYLDLAPQVPDSITVEVEEDLVTLNWRFNTEADFNRYQVFRDTVSGFTPSEFNMIAEPDTSYYEDQDIDPGTAYYYRLTSVDNQGNISDFSDEVAVIPTGIWSSAGDRLPGYTVIESAYPNPFNSNVTIVYSASNLGPQPPQVKLQIFDIQGRVVRTLVDDRMPMGTYRAVWDGTNERGESVSSGTYIAKVFQWGMDAGDFPVKITLLK